MGPQFFQTPMGRTFYDHTMPELVHQLKRFNTNFEAALALATKVASRWLGDANPNPGDTEHGGR